MNIVVCVKEVADPEAPFDSFRVDTERKVIFASPSVMRVLSPFDEQAVEAALRIKDKMEAKVSVISLGNKLDRVVVKKPLLMGADELFLLEDEAFEGGDSFSTAYALSSAIKKIGSYDLVLCGRQSADTNAGQVGAGIAYFLGIPLVTVARKIDVSDGKARVEKVVSDGYEVVETTLPCVITVSSELGQPRYPSIHNIRRANELKPIIWKPADIGLDPSLCGKKGSKLHLLKLFQPVYESSCHIIEGDTPVEAAHNLALRLRAVRII